MRLKARRKIVFSEKITKPFKFIRINGIMILTTIKDVFL